MYIIPIHETRMNTGKVIILKALKYLVLLLAPSTKTKIKTTIANKAEQNKCQPKGKPSRLSSTILNYNSEKPKVLN